MRKDYIESKNDSTLDETTFVENFWTNVWEKEGGPKGRLERVYRQDEYRLMMPYLEKLKPQARILDGGCGLGDWVLALRNKGFDMVGLDLSQKTIDQLKTRFPEVEFVAGDIRKTQFLPSYFDAYFSWRVFEHFEMGPLDCLKEAMRLLKPGGLLFVSVPQDNLRHSLRSVFSKALTAPIPNRFYQYRFTRQEIAHQLGLAGFELLAVKAIHKKQGVLRALNLNFGLPLKSRITKGLALLLSLFVPGSFVGHMVVAIGRKPE